MTFKPKMDLTGLTAEQRVWADRLAAHLAVYGKHNPKPYQTPVSYTHLTLPTIYSV